MMTTTTTIFVGHAVQWGEVKSKKSKKEAANKAKASTQPPSSQTMSSMPQPHRTSERQSGSKSFNNESARRGKLRCASFASAKKRGLNFYFCKGGGGSAYRSGRGNRGLPTHQPSHQQVASWGKQSKPIQSSETNAVDKGGSWASIASAPKPQPATTNDNSWNDVSANNSWEAPTSTSDGWGAAAASTVNDEWSKPSWDTTTETSVNHSTQNHESSETKNNSSISAEPTPSSPAPKTWASLLKYVHRISDHNGFRKP